MLFKSKSHAAKPSAIYKRDSTRRAEKSAIHKRDTPENSSAWAAARVFALKTAICGTFPAIHWGYKQTPTHEASNDLPHIAV